MATQNDPFNGMSLDELDLSDAETREYVSQHIDMNDPETKAYMDSFVKPVQAGPSPQVEGPVPVSTPQGTVTIGGDESPIARPTGQIQDVIVQGANPLKPFSLGQGGEQTYLDMASDPNVTAEQINQYLSQQAAAEGRTALPIDEGALRQYREDLAKGKTSGGVQYSQDVATKMLGGDFVPEVDPTLQGSGVAASLERGMAYSPFRALDTFFRDWTDSELQGGLSKDTIKTLYPNMTDEDIENVHDSLIGELRRRELANAGFQTEQAPINPVADFGLEAVGGASLIDLIPFGRAATLPGRLGVSAVANMAADAALQGTDVAYDAQDEFSYGQNLIAGAAGVALHGAIEGTVHGVGKVAEKILPERAPATITPETDIAAPEATNRRTKAYKQQIKNVVQQSVDHINETTKDWQNAPSIEVHDNFSKLPSNVDRKAIGVFDAETGKININVENVIKYAKKKGVGVKDVLNSVTYHEGLGHHGMLQLFSDDLDTALHSFYENGTQSFKKAIDNWLEANPKSYVHGEGDAKYARAVEEYLAEKSEQGALPKKFADTLKNLVKEYGRKMGMDLKYSTREVDSILSMAHDAVRNGKGRDVRSNGYKYMYVGERAELNSGKLDALDEAKLMEKEGKDVGPGGKSRDLTGWFKAPDNKWRFEINDKGSTIMSTEGGQALGDILDHPELYRMYPEAKDMVITREKGGNFYEPSQGYVNIDPVMGNGKKFHKTLLHEIQHAIQEHEDFARGGDPKSAIYAVDTKTVMNGAKKYVDWLDEEVARYKNSLEAYEGKDLSNADQTVLDYINSVYNYIGPLMNEAKDIRAALKTGDKYLVRESIDPEGSLAFQAYENLFGEVEARDTAERLKLDEYGREAVEPYTTEGIVSPDEYTFVDRYGRRTRSEAAPSNKYMMPKEEMTPQEMGDTLDAERIVKEALDSYIPTNRTWEEAAYDAQQKGFTRKQIGSTGRKVEDLDRKLLQMDALAGRYNDKVAALTNKVSSGQFTPNDAARLAQLSTEYSAAIDTIFGAQAEVGRALNIMKKLEYTRRNLTSVQDILKEITGSHLSPEESYVAMAKYAQRLNNALSTGNQGAINNMAQNFTKPYWWQKILTARHAAMLSGLGTLTKNIVDSASTIVNQFESNLIAVAGQPIRKGLRVAGFDAKEGMSIQEYAANTYGMMHALTDMNTYIATGKAFTEGMQPHSPGTSAGGMEFARIPGISKVQDTLFAVDTFFRTFLETSEMYGQGVRKAFDDGFAGVDALSEGIDNARFPDAEMTAEAKRMADQALLVDTPSLITSKLEAIKAIRPGMTPGQQALAFTANIALPFLRVTDRILFAKIRRTPFVAFLDKNTRADFAAGGARRDQAIARQLMGSAMIASAWAAAGAGELEGEGPEYEKKQALEGAGYMPRSVEQDGNRVDVSATNFSFMPTDYNNQFSTNIATIRQAYERGLASEEDTASALATASASLLALFGTQSFANNLAPYVETLQAIGEGDSSATAASANLVGGIASSFVPAAVRQFNQMVVDPYKRDTTGDGSFTDRVAGRVMSGIPGLSDNLPQKIDVYGDPMVQGKSLSGTANYQPIKQDAASKALGEVERSTDEVVVKGAPSSFEVEGSRIKLTGREKQEWNKVQGSYMKQAMDEILPNPAWKKLTDAQRQEAVKEIRKEAYEAAKESFLSTLDVDTFLKRTGMTMEDLEDIARTEDEQGVDND